MKQYGHDTQWQLMQAEALGRLQTSAKEDDPEIIFYTNFWYLALV